MAIEDRRVLLKAAHIHYLDPNEHKTHLRDLHLPICLLVARNARELTQHRRESYVHEVLTDWSGRHMGKDDGELARSPSLPIHLYCSTPSKTEERTALGGLSRRGMPGTFSDWYALLVADSRDQVFWDSG